MACYLVCEPVYNQAISINVYNQRGLFLVATPWMLSSRPNLFVKLFVGMVSGSRNLMVIVKMFYLYCVTLKLKIIVLVHGHLDPLRDVRFQGHGGSTTFIHRLSNCMTKKA